MWSGKCADCSPGSFRLQSVTAMARKARGINLGIPEASLSPQLAEDLTRAWPEMGQICLAWWRKQVSQASAPGEKFERVTFHVAPKWVERIKREAEVRSISQLQSSTRLFRSIWPPELRKVIQRLIKWAQEDRSLLSKEANDDLDEALKEEFERFLRTAAEEGGTSK